MPRRPARGSQIFGAVLLQETVGTIMVFDLKGFTKLSAGLSPIDLGVVLGHYYGFAEKIIQENDGRLVKFMGDAVLGVWLTNDVPSHKKQALAAVAQAANERPAWMADNQKGGLPPLDFTVASAAGPVLAGQIGTARNRTFDVLGAPVNTAVTLVGVAAARSMEHLLALAEPDPACVEVEGVEIAGKLTRLFRLASA
jgi:class 3 adenylate cyclase